ncbi:MAG: glycoside hydrolase domain-containing protein [Bacteroidota bacterium]
MVFRGAIRFLLPLFSIIAHPSYSQSGLSRVWAIDDGEKILQSKINHTAANGTNNPVWDGSSISLFGGKNEVVAFQLILQGNGTGATGVNVTLDSLTKSSVPGYTIKNTGGFGDPYDYEGKRIEMFVEHYQNITSRSNASFLWWSAARPLPDADYLGMLPEQLVPFEATAGAKTHGQGGAPFRVPANGNQAVWVDIYVPRETPAGLYSGTLRVTENAVQRYSIPVTLRVYNFTLSDTTHLSSMFFIDYPAITGRHGVTKWSSAYWNLMKKYYAMGHRHRADFTDGRLTLSNFATNLGSMYTGSYYTSANNYEGPGEGVGNSTYSIGTYDQPARASQIGSSNGTVSGFTYNADTTIMKTTWQTVSTAWVNWFTVNAPATRIHKYMADEPGITSDTSILFDIRRKARWLKTNPGAGQSLRTLCTSNIRPDLRGSIDIWMGAGQSGYVNGGYNPYPGGYVVDSANAARSRGEMAGFYNGCSPAYGTQAIDAPGTHMRVNPWIAWKYKTDLYFLWYVNHWGDESGNPIDPWAGDKRNQIWGDGSFVYAGENKNSTLGNDRGLAGPIAGIRMKSWRRGAQDYEYLHLARQMGLNVSAIVDSLVPAAFDETPQNQQAKFAQRGYRFEQFRKQLAELIENNTGSFPTGTFSATPQTLPAGGGTVTLNWSSSNATSASINNGIGNVTLSGSTQVTVTTSTTFRLTISNAVGSQVLSVPVTVEGSLPSPAGTFIVTPDTLPAGGGDVTLIWVSSNATSASINNGIDSVSLNGSLVTSITSTTLFRLTLSNPGGNQVLEKTVYVRAAMPVPGGTFVATPDSLPIGGGQVTLIWVSDNATSALIDNGIGPVAVNGFRTVTVTSPTTYALTLSNSSGSQVLSASVRIGGSLPSPTGSFSATPDTLPPGGGIVTLSWSSQNATSASIDNGVGTVALNGSLAVNVAASTVFRLSLTNSTGTQELAVPVFVQQVSGLPTGTFFVSSDSLPVGGGNVTLIWVSDNATSASINNGIGAVPVNGSLNVNLTSSANYAITLTNPVGSIVLTVSVVVGGVPPVPTGTFVAIPDSLPPGGGSVMLVWVSSHAQDAALDHGIGSVPVNGSVNVLVTSSREYRLTLSNITGQHEASVNISVAGAPPRPSGTFVVVPDTLPEGGGNVTLIWVSNNASSASIDHNIGTVPVNGATTASVTSSRTLHLTLVNSSGASTISAPVVVRGSAMPLPLGSLTISPDTLPSGGGNITLSWSSTNADSRFINNGIGSVDENGSLELVVGTTTVYTLTVANSTGSYNYSATIVVPLPDVGPADITINGDIQALTTAPTGSGNPNIEIIRDGFAPPVNTTNPLEQYDTKNGNVTKIFEWIGYQFSSPQIFTGMFFQEGMHFPDGGWFDELSVQVRVGGMWIDVDEWTISPPYAGGNGVHYEMFDIRFPETVGDAIRIAGVPGGAGRYISLGELRVLKSATFNAPIAMFLVTPDSLPADGGLVTLHWSVANAQSVFLNGGIGEVPSSGSRTERITDPVSFTLTASGNAGSQEYEAAVSLARPKDYFLYDNFPNPFNPTTMIRYTVSVLTEVSLVIYDILGRQVRMLHKEIMQPGSKVVEWDGRDDNGQPQSSGTYIFRFTADGFVEARKMVLLK